MNWPQGIKSGRIVSGFQHFDIENRSKLAEKKKNIKVNDQSGNIKSDGAVTIKRISDFKSSATVFICFCTLNTKVTNIQGT